VIVNTVVLSIAVDVTSGVPPITVATGVVALACIAVAEVAVPRLAVMGLVVRTSRTAAMGPVVIRLNVRLAQAMLARSAAATRTKNVALPRVKKYAKTSLAIICVIPARSNTINAPIVTRCWEKVILLKGFTRVM
jgi:hypothetical protein